jgi:hypothetical protein
MAQKTYREKLLDPRWQKKRLERLEASNWACDSCEEKEKTLHVHHRRYFKGREPWEYSLSELMTLCWACHQELHKDRELLEDVIAQACECGGPNRLIEIAVLVMGFCEGKVEAFIEGGQGYHHWDEYQIGVAASAMTRHSARQLLAATRESGQSLSPPQSWLADQHQEPGGCH